MPQCDTATTEEGEGSVPPSQWLQESKQAQSRTLSQKEEEEPRSTPWHNTVQARGTSASTKREEWKLEAK